MIMKSICNVVPQVNFVLISHLYIFKKKQQHCHKKLLKILESMLEP